MSTYNGQDYLAEQLESIINQSYSNWQVFIRDDGSKDRTEEIIHEYVSKDSRIVYLSEMSLENVGVKKSFLSLLLAVESDYYFFCDQDDFWLPNKVADTLNLLKKEERGDLPVCVHTDLEIVNQSLVKIDSSMIESQNLYKEDHLKELLVQNSVTGCTTALNYSLKQLILKQPNAEHILMHDWWIALVAAAFGKVVLLDMPTILYRQHGNNEVGAQSMITKIKSGYNLDKVLSAVVAAYVQAQELLDVYSDSLPVKERKEIEFYLSILSTKQSPFFYHKWFQKFKKKGFLKNLVFILINTFYNKRVRKQVTEKKSRN
ncbi:glycosyltransferase family 2 protein [Enterococcus sp. LJL98]